MDEAFSATKPGSPGARHPERSDVAKIAAPSRGTLSKAFGGSHGQRRNNAYRQTFGNHLGVPTAAHTVNDQRIELTRCS